MNVLTTSDLRSIIRSQDKKVYSINLGNPCIRRRSLFSKLFNWPFVRMDLRTGPIPGKVRSFICPETTAIAVLGLGSERSLGEWEVVGCRV